MIAILGATICFLLGGIIILCAAILLNAFTCWMLEGRRKLNRCLELLEVNNGQRKD